MARILLAKVGADAHDMGITVVANWLRDAGHEVDYAGLYNTPERLLRLARETRPDIIGISYLGGEPIYLSGRVMDLLRRDGLDIPLVVGGVLTPEMFDELAQLGVARVFTPGTARETILEGVAAVVAGDRRNI